MSLLIFTVDSIKNIQVLTDFLLWLTIKQAAFSHMYLIISFSQKTSSNEEIFLMGSFVFSQSQKKVGIRLYSHFFFISKNFGQVCRSRKNRENYQKNSSAVTPSIGFLHLNLHKDELPCCKHAVHILRSDVLLPIVCCYLSSLQAYMSFFFCCSQLDD